MFVHICSPRVFETAIYVMPGCCWLMMHQLLSILVKFEIYFAPRTALYRSDAHVFWVVFDCFCSKNQTVAAEVAPMDGMATHRVAVEGASMQTSAIDGSGRAGHTPRRQSAGFTGQVRVLVIVRCCFHLRRSCLGCVQFPNN